MNAIEWTAQEISRKPREKTDNALSKTAAMAKATREDNRKKATGIKGISWDRITGRYIVRTYANREVIYVASCATLEEAKGALEHYRDTGQRDRKQKKESTLAKLESML